MTQKLSSAFFMGPKEPEAARKVIKLAAYFGFISISLALIVLVIPYAPLQAAIDQNITSRLIVFGAAGFSIICLIFMLKEKFWAPCVLTVLTVADMGLAFMETGDIPSSLECIKLVIYASATQAVYFLKKNKETLLDQGAEIEGAERIPTERVQE